MGSGERIPTGRWRRSTKIGRLAAQQAARQAGTRAANLTRDDEAAQEALSRRQLETAEQIVTALGTMKGAAMKIGQTLSFLDVGLVPAEFRDEFQAKLAALRDAAPKVSFEQMRRVLEEEYGEPADRVFAYLDPDPIAAASIGQVYRARLPDGRDVAVKVQYPGIAAAVRADLQNLGLILWLLKGIAPGLDPHAVGREIAERLEEELDYELEAANQRSLARIYRGHPFIVVPDVVGALSHERVIVTELVTGRGFEECRRLPDAERNRIGEIIFRFYFGSMYRHHQFSGDPHPGNSLLLDDGRMAFLDFGLFKRLPEPVAEFELEMLRLGIRREGDALLDHLARGGWIGDRGAFTADEGLSQFDRYAGWLTRDEETTLTSADATRIMLELSDPRSAFFGRARRETLPPDHLFGRRVEMLTLAVLGQLNVTANWGAIAREWIEDAPPQTDLGRREAEFLAQAR